LNAAETPIGVSAMRSVFRAVQSLAKRVAVGAALSVVACSIWSASATEAAAETRSLKLYFVHTGEKAVITYKRNGRFDSKGLAQINNLLRDWRKNEPTKMDPRLFDLVWEVYRRSGAKDYIHVVSAYRSPATNGMLRGRSRSSGVAKNSQHTLGKAMDFYIPGVKLATLRGLAMQMQVGGVGYYPKSGSPFVHLDVGGVRAWPRMTRQELAQIFPNGNTLHLPSDGQPLPGYAQALTDYKKRVGSDSIEIASTAGGAPAAERRRRGFLATLFGGGADEEEDNSESTTPTMVSPRQQQPSAPATRPAAPVEAPPTPVMVAAAEPQQPEDITAPIPESRPAFRQEGAGGLATALYSQQRNPAQEALALQTAAAANGQAGGENFADLSNYSVPVPTLLGPRGLRGDAENSTMTASLGDVPASLQQMAAVPLPANRPGMAQVADGAPVAQPSSSPKREEEQMLTPELVAALSRSVVEDAQSTAPPASVRPVADTAVAAPPAPSPANRPTEVAALPPKVIQAPSRARQFGDGFDAPKTVSASVGATPTKGARPTSPSAASHSPGHLTQDTLAKWALNNNRAGDVVSMKAPRVVTRTLNGDYAAGYASAGFKPVSAAVAVDPNRFSGQN
jgi:uncharacterized protein YcbK (DUF882 family)